MGSLAITASRLRDMNRWNLMRKSLVSFLSPSNLSGGFPSSHPHLGWSVVLYRSKILKGLSPVPRGFFPLAVDNLSGMVSLGSICEWILLALARGWLCLRLSQLFGSPLSP